MIIDWPLPFILRDGIHQELRRPPRVFECQRRAPLDCGRSARGAVVRAFQDGLCHIER